MRWWSRAANLVHCSVANTRSFSHTTSTATSKSTPPATSGAASAGRVNPEYRAASISFARWLQQSGLKGFSQLTQPHDSSAPATPRVLGFGIKQSAHNDWQLVASCSIAANQPILSLPLSITLPLDDPQQHTRSYSDIEPLLSLVPQHLWQLRLGLRLLSERTKQYSTTGAATASFYQPYIDLLPLAYSTPLFYQREDVAALQYPPIQQQINKRSRLLSTLSHAITTAQQRSGSVDPFHGQSISPSLLGWAMSAVSSRAFSFHSHRRLLPLIDMANHSFTPSTRIELTDTQPALTLYATRDLQAGDELTINYGPHSNDAYLIDYGFVIDDNPHDDLLLTFDLNNVQLALELIGESEAEVRLDGWKRRLVDGMDKSDFRITRDGLDRRLIALWLLHLTPMDSSLSHSLTSLSDTYFSIQQPTHSLATLQRIHRATSVFLSLVAGSWNRAGLGGDGQGEAVGSGGVGGMEEDLKELMEAAQLGREERTTAIRYRIAKKWLLREQLNRIEKQMSNTSV